MYMKCVVTFLSNNRYIKQNFNMKELTINQMLDDIQYAVEKEPDLQMMVKEGLQLILDKFKDAEKWQKSRKKDQKR